jgi:hypothetical protein
MPVLGDYLRGKAKHALGLSDKAPTFGSLIKRDVGASLSKNFGMVGAYADYRLNRVKTTSILVTAPPDGRFA